MYSNFLLSSLAEYIFVRNKFTLFGSIQQSLSWLYCTLQWYWSVVTQESGSFSNGLLHFGRAHWCSNFPWCHTGWQVYLEPNGYASTKSTSVEGCWVQIKAGHSDGDAYNPASSQQAVQYESERAGGRKRKVHQRHKKQHRPAVGNTSLLLNNSCTLAAVSPSNKETCWSHC